MLKELSRIPYFALLWRWRWFLLLFCGGTFLSTVFFTLRYVPRTYQSDTVIIVSASNRPSLPSLLGGQGTEEALSLLSPGSLTMSTEFYKGILGSRNVAQRVVERFHLREYYEVEEVQEAVEELQKVTSIQVTKEGFLKVTTTLEGTPRLSRLSEIFRKEVSQERDQLVREQVAEMANFYITALQDYSNETQLDEAHAHREFLEQQVGKARWDQEWAYLNLQRFQEKKGHISLTDELRTSLEAHGQLRSQILLAQSKVEELQTQIQEVRARLRSQMQDPLQLPAHAPLLGDLRRKLQELKYEYDTKTIDMQPEHPEMQFLQVQIKQVQKDIAAETHRVLQAVEKGTSPELQDLEVQKAAAMAEVASLKSELQRLEKQFGGLPADQKTLAQLTLETEVQSQLLTLLVTQLKQAEIAEDQEGKPFHVLDRAGPPLKQVTPRLVVNAGVGVALSLVMGLCLAFLLESIRSSEAAEKGQRDGIEPEEERLPHLVDMEPR